MVTADSELSHAENSPSPLLISHPPTALYRSYYPFPSKAFILSDFNLFLHPFLPTFFYLAPSIHPSIHPSACPHRLRHPTRLTSNRCATVVLLLKLCCSCSIFTHRTLSEVKKSQRFVYIWVGEKKLEVSPSRESKADSYTGHQSD